MVGDAVGGTTGGETIGAAGSGATGGTDVTTGGENGGGTLVAGAFKSISEKLTCVGFRFESSVLVATTPA